MTILNIQDLSTFEELSNIEAQSLNGQLSSSTVSTTGDGFGFGFSSGTGLPPSFTFTGFPSPTPGGFPTTPTPGLPGSLSLLPLLVLL